MKHPIVMKPGETQAMQVVDVRIGVLASRAQTEGKYEVFCLEGNGPASWVRPLHTHPWDEVFFVVEGEAEFKLGDQTVSLGAGGFVNVPGNTPHDFRLASQSVKMIIFTTEAETSGFFADLSREITSMPPDRAALAAIMERHGVKPVVPQGIV